MTHEQSQRGHHDHEQLALGIALGGHLVRLDAKLDHIVELLKKGSDLTPEAKAKFQVVLDRLTALQTPTQGK